MRPTSRVDFGVMLIGVAGLVLLGIGMLGGEILEVVITTPEVPEGATLVERADAITKMVDDVSKLGPDVGTNLFSTIGKGLVITPFLAGGFAIDRIIRGRGIPTRAIAEFAIVTSLIAGATILIRLTVPADSGGALAAVSRALGADRGVDVALDTGGQVTVVALAVMCVAGLLALDIGRRGAPGDPFGRQSR